MNKLKQIQVAKLMIASGLGLIVLAVFLVLYWWMNQTPIIVTKYLSNLQESITILPQEEKDWQLEIPKIEVSAPININIDGGNELEYLSALEAGVAHLAGSSLPGQPGNVFVFGHSSYYFYARGKYKSVFKNLNKLESGDGIKIISNLNTYNYQVINKKIVNPDEVDVIQPIDENHNTITLMTCTPLYTSLKRLIIIAKET